MRLLAICLLLLGLATHVPTPARAAGDDIVVSRGDYVDVYLTDGSVLRGRVIKALPDRLRLTLDNGRRMEIAAELIQDISYASVREGSGSEADPEDESLPRVVIPELETLDVVSAVMWGSGVGLVGAGVGIHAFQFDQRLLDRSCIFGASCPTPALALDGLGFGLLSTSQALTIGASDRLHRRLRASGYRAPNTWLLLGSILQAVGWASVGLAAGYLHDDGGASEWWFPGSLGLAGALTGQIMLVWDFQNKLKWGREGRDRRTRRWKERRWRRYEYRQQRRQQRRARRS